MQLALINPGLADLSQASSYWPESIAASLVCIEIHLSQKIHSKCNWSILMNICSFYSNYYFILFKVDFCDKQSFMILEQFLPDKALSHNKKALDELLVNNSKKFFFFFFFFYWQIQFQGQKVYWPELCVWPSGTCLTQWVDIDLKKKVLLKDRWSPDNKILDLDVGTEVAHQLHCHKHR